MHPDALTAVCAAASTPSLRILRALNLLQAPQRPEELAEGLELCPSIVSHELSTLEAAGIIRTAGGHVHLGIRLSSLFGGPLAHAMTELPCPQERKASRV
ncbi:ArsR family transcriptional regulator [Pseudarthrobacter chlorophenolicus]